MKIVPSCPLVLSCFTILCENNLEEIWNAQRQWQLGLMKHIYSPRLARMCNVLGAILRTAETKTNNYKPGLILECPAGGLERWDQRLRTLAALQAPTYMATHNCL